MEAQSLKERPFPEGAHSLAADLGAETESTPTVPPFLAIKLMEYSARTVLEASELEVGGAISSATVVDLLTACWVIVATFTARRAEEIFELSDHSDGDENPGGCLEGNRSNGWYLRIYIAKTHKETTWIPVPELLVRAIEYSALSARKRGLNLVVNSFSDGLTREANHDDSMHRIVLIGLL
jgi:hypothetical protein